MNPPRRSTYFPHGFGEGPDLVRPLLYLFAALLLGSAFWYLFTPRNAASTEIVRTPQAGLELVLSGVLTSNLSFRADDLSELRCTPSGFSAQSLGDTVTPIALSFAGTGSETGSYELLDSSSALTLTAAGARYTLQSGSVSTAPGLRTFNASLIDAQGQPLQLSGRLSCP